MTKGALKSQASVLGLDVHLTVGSFHTEQVVAIHFPVGNPPRRCTESLASTSLGGRVCLIAVLNLAPCPEGLGRCVRKGTVRVVWGQQEDLYQTLFLDS